MDFDLETYLSSNDDSSGLHSNYDIDIDLNFDHFQESSMETNTDLKSDVSVTDFHNEDNKDVSHIVNNTSLVDKNRSNRSHKLSIPITEMTDRIKIEIEKMSNPLVVSLGEKRSAFKSVKCSNTCCKTESNRSLNKTKFLQLSINPLCDKGDTWLLAQTATHKDSDDSCRQSDTVHNRNETPIRHVSVDSKSFWLMKYLCQDTGDVENYAYLKGNLLLPRVNKHEDNFHKNPMESKKQKKRSKVLKMRRSRKVSPLSSSSDENNNVNSGDASTTGDSCVSGVVPAHDRVTFEEKCCSYPKFKLNYMSSLKERMDRIENLPLPTKSIELMNDLNVTDCEKLTMPEFFHTDQQTARYLQIRNHILIQWKECKPNYLRKTFVRNGLQGCGDVNVISIVHRYLEKIGAINFTCDKGDVVVKEGQHHRPNCDPISADYTSSSESMDEACYGVS